MSSIELPLLDLVESLKLRNRDKDDNGLLATTNLDLKPSSNTILVYKYSRCFCCHVALDKKGGLVVELPPWRQ